jgi:hypothetical protein
MNHLTPKRTQAEKRKKRIRGKVKADQIRPLEGTETEKPVVRRQSPRPRCGKCAGWIIEDGANGPAAKEIKCLNCGWKPQYHDRIIVESEEIRSIRQYTHKLFLKQ